MIPFFKIIYCSLEFSYSGQIYYIIFNFTKDFHKFLHNSPQVGLLSFSNKLFLGYGKKFNEHE